MTDDEMLALFLYQNGRREAEMESEHSLVVVVVVVATRQSLVVEPHVVLIDRLTTQQGVKEQSQFSKPVHQQEFYRECLRRPS